MEHFQNTCTLYFVLMSLSESLPISESFYLSYFTEHQECNCKVIAGEKNSSMSVKVYNNDSSIVE